MDDAFLMRVLHRVADRNEEPEPFRSRKPRLIAVLGDFFPGTNSMTKNGRPAGVAPASSTFAMFG